MTLFDDRLEGEMKTHEKEMLHKAVIKKYGSKPLPERMQYVMSIYHKDSWTAAEMFSKLSELEIQGSNTEAEVENALNNPDNHFSA